MFKRGFQRLVMGAVAMAVAACGAAPGEESEQIGSESEELPCTNCGGDGEYTPYSPDDYYCGYGENGWNSGRDCGPGRACEYGSVGGCTASQTCRGDTGCVESTQVPPNSPCANKSYLAYCTLSNGGTGKCKYNIFYKLACFP